MAEAGLLEAHGEKRGRVYVPTKNLRQVWDTIRARRPAPTDDSPYPVGTQPTLPGL